MNIWEAETTGGYYGGPLELQRSVDGAEELSVVHTNKPVLLTAKAGVKGSDRPWFASRALNSETRSGPLYLNNQFLYSIPAYAPDNTVLGLVWIWREVDPENPKKQNLCIEIVNTSNTSGSKTREIGTDIWDLSSGSFSISFPEEALRVDYGRQDQVERDNEPPVSTFVSHTEHFNKGSVPQVPGRGTTDGMYHLHPFAALDSSPPDNQLLPTSETIPKLREDKILHSVSDTSIKEQSVARKATSQLTSHIPVLSSAKGIVSPFSWAVERYFGDPFKSTAAVGNKLDYVVNPNKNQRVILSWKHTSGGFDAEQEALVVAKVPLVFNDLQPVDIFVGADWKFKSPSSKLGVSWGTGFGTLGHMITTGPIGRSPVVGEKAPTDPDDDGEFEDVNGDGEVTNEDAVALANHLQDPAVTENTRAFDFNDNGRIDYDDVVELFEETEP